MKKHNLTMLALTIAIAAMAAASADVLAAEDTTIGVSIGARTHYGLHCASGITCERNAGSSAKISFGKQLEPHFGVEAMAFRLGEAKGDVKNGSTTVPGTAKANGLGVSAVASTELGAFTLKGKLGAAYVRGSTNFAAGGSAGKSSFVLPTVGASVSYAIDKKWALNADWDNLPTRLNSGTKTHVNLLSLGLQYKF